MDGVQFWCSGRRGAMMLFSDMFTASPGAPGLRGLRTTVSGHSLVARPAGFRAATTMAYIGADHRNQAEFSPMEN
eukprot:11179953-Lingulodinium_polyedra.AAC.1